MLWKNCSEKKLWYWLDTYSTRAIESAIFIRHYTLHCLRLCEDIFIILALGSVIFLPQLKCIECKNKGKWFYGIRYNTKYLILILNKREKISLYMNGVSRIFDTLCWKDYKTWRMKPFNGQWKNSEFFKITIFFTSKYLSII